MPGRVKQGIAKCPLFTIEFKEEDIGLEGFVCIHSLGRLGASGGMRCAPDVTKKEVELLAQAMAYKYAFFDVEQGGAKAGLRVSYESTAEQKHFLVRQAARHLKPILLRANFWSPWSDMNFYGNDLLEFYGEIGRKFSYNPKSNSSLRTAISAFWSIQATLEHYRLKDRPVSLSIEGFGSVASYLAPMLAELNVKVVGVSNRFAAAYNPHGFDLLRLADLRDRRGDDWILTSGNWEMLSQEELFDLDVDILVPCARVHSIDKERARRTRAKIILPIANVPCTAEALEHYDQIGIDYIPDFVVNGGGILGHIRDANHSFGRSFKQMFIRMLKAADSASIPVRRIATEIADANANRIEGVAYTPQPVRYRLVDIATSRGIVPSSIHRFINRERHQRIYKRVHTLFFD